MTIEIQAENATGRRGWMYYSCAGCAGILLIVVVTALLTAWWVNRQFNAPPFQAVQLSAQEAAVLEEKIARATLAPPVDPEAETRRPIVLTEKELNGWFHEQTQLGERVYLDLLNDGLRARVNVPMEADAPIFPGRTFRAALTLRIVIAAERLQVIVQNLSVGGIPLPRAWLGELKGADLAELYLGNDEAMSRLVAGVESFDIAGDELRLMLAE